MIKRTYLEELGGGFLIGVEETSNGCIIDKYHFIIGWTSWRLDHGVPLYYHYHLLYSSSISQSHNSLEGRREEWLGSQVRVLWPYPFPLEGSGSSLIAITYIVTLAILFLSHCHHYLLSSTLLHNGNGAVLCPDDKVTLTDPWDDQVEPFVIEEIKPHSQFYLLMV